MAVIMFDNHFTLYCDADHADWDERQERVEGLPS